MTGSDELLADPRVQRVVNLLGQYGLRSEDCARLLRNVAEWYEPTDKLKCQNCRVYFLPSRSTARYCSAACRQAFYRRNRNMA